MTTQSNAKSQALTITLAVLLVAALSARVALVVSGEVRAASETTVEPIETLVTTPEPVEAVDVGTVPEPSTPEVDAPAPTEPSPQPAEPAPGEPEAPVEDDDAPAIPEDDEEADDDDAPAVPEDDEEADDDDAPAIPEDDEEADDEEPAEDEAGCKVGFWLIGGNCVFVGCPDGYVEFGTDCLKVDLPCPKGFVRAANGECRVAILDLDLELLTPVECGEGFKSVDGECVPVCPANHTYINGLCLPVNGGANIPKFDFNATFDS